VSNLLNGLLSSIKALKGSLTSYLYLGLATLLGVAVLAFKQQGRALHKAQVTILGQNLEKSQELSDERVVQASQAYDAAKTAFREAMKP
jgi:hypothetical protein